VNSAESKGSYKMLPKKRFKKGDRVFDKNCGYGTVHRDSYYARDFTTWTCVVYDDFLGQKYPLCDNDEKLVLVEEEK
jgi:hypothetical protein